MEIEGTAGVSGFAINFGVQCPSVADDQQSNNGFAPSVFTSMVNLMVGLRLLCDYRIPENCPNHEAKSHMCFRRIGATVTVSIPPLPARVFQNAP